MTLEELLNSLIQRGWKPYGNELYSGAKMNSSTQVGLLIKKDTGYMNIPYTLREIVSKESGLWQFVCENGMVAEKSEGILYRYDDYKYRLTNCALKDESELEDFLLSNIKVDE